MVVIGSVVNYLDGHWCLIKTVEKKISGVSEQKVFVKLGPYWNTPKNMKPYTKARAASTTMASLKELSPNSMNLSRYSVNTSAIKQI